MGATVAGDDVAGDDVDEDAGEAGGVAVAGARTDADGVGDDVDSAADEAPSAASAASTGPSTVRRVSGAFDVATGTDAVASGSS